MAVQFPITASFGFCHLAVLCLLLFIVTIMVVVGPEKGLRRILYVFPVLARGRPDMHDFGTLVIKDSTGRSIPINNDEAFIMTEEGLVPIDDYLTLRRNYYIARLWLDSIAQDKESVGAVYSDRDHISNLGIRKFMCHALDRVHRFRGAGARDVAIETSEIVPPTLADAYVRYASWNSVSCHYYMPMFRLKKLNGEDLDS